MGLREQIADDLKDAMRRQDRTRMRALRGVIAALNLADTELDAQGQRVQLKDEDIVVIIGRLARQREESIFEFRRGGRLDLVAEEEADLAILHEFLPQQMSRDEIAIEARKVIAEVGATSVRDIGKVMKPLMARVRGRADGKVVNQVVQELLSG